MRLEVLPDHGGMVRMSCVHPFLLPAHLYTTFVMASLFNPASLLFSELAWNLISFRSYAGILTHVPSGITLEKPKIRTNFRKNPERGLKMSALILESLSAPYESLQKRDDAMAGQINLHIVMPF